MQHAVLVLEFVSENRARPASGSPRGLVIETGTIHVEVVVEVAILSKECRTCYEASPVVVRVKVSPVVVVIEHGQFMLPLPRSGYVQLNAPGEIALASTLVRIWGEQLLAIEVPNSRHPG